MFRSLAIAFSLLAPLPALALCNGDRFETYLSAEEQAEIDSAVDATLYGEGLFWDARKDGTTLTIVGTMHLPDPRHETLLNRLRPSLDAADLLLVEATLQDQTDMQTFMANNPDMMVIGDGPSLPEVLEEDTWAAISQAASDRGVPGFMAAKMQPWFLLLTLSIPACAAADMMSGEGGLDAMLMRSADYAGIETQALEPWQDMFDLLSAGTFDEQVDALRMGLLPSDISDALMTSLTEDYFDGQTARAWEMSFYTYQFLPDMDRSVFDEQLAIVEDILLKERNVNWIPVIEEAAAQHDKIIVAFGAAHLIGEQGVLNLLSQSGWSVSPL